MSLVNVSIVGNAVRSPEHYQFNNGQTKTVITVAVDSPPRPGGEKETEFYKVEAWGRLAEIAQKYISKGAQVGVSGRLVLEKWQSKDGRDRVTPTVKAHQISLPPRMRLVQAVEANSNSSGALHRGSTPDDADFAQTGGSEDEFDEALGIGREPEVSKEMFGEVINGDFTRDMPPGAQTSPASSNLNEELFVASG